MSERNDHQSKAKAQKKGDPEDLTKRRGQLEKVQQSIPALRSNLRRLKDLRGEGEALSSHLRGYYEEVDKLTKGKSLIAVTELFVERMNEIIQDAKRIIKKDTYLDRVKEFVPAGDNPVFPDVLMTARTVKDALDRFTTHNEEMQQRTSNLITEAMTLDAALRLYLHYKTVPTQEYVDFELDGERRSDKWFLYSSATSKRTFDINRLDRIDLAYLTDDSIDNEPTTD